MLSDKQTTQVETCRGSWVSDWCPCIVLREKSMLEHVGHWAGDILVVNWSRERLKADVANDGGDAGEGWPTKWLNLRRRTPISCRIFTDWWWTRRFVVGHQALTHVNSTALSSPVIRMHGHWTLRPHSAVSIRRDLLWICCTFRAKNI